MKGSETHQASGKFQHYYSVALKNYYIPITFNVKVITFPKSTASGYEGWIQRDRKHDHHTDVA
jgi:hypothetical protein